MDTHIILEKIENAGILDFGSIFNKSLGLFQKVWVQGFIMLLLTIGLMIPFYILMYLPVIALGLFDSEAFQHDRAPDLIVLVSFGLLVLGVSFFAMIIAFGLKAAFYRICKRKDLNEIGTDDYFYFFKKSHLAKTITLTAITFGISIVAVLLCVLPIIYVAVPLALINVVYAFNPEMSASDIIKVGFKLGNKKWLITFGLLVVSGILAQFVGMIMCFVGVVFTASFGYLPAYFIYKETVSLERSDDIESIGNP
ncbi:hypothetical protein [Aestuariivivens sediminis]|uniref:hypothetical protein n=1 Tax=Aestuariivivens sediminis TaxID=2913557 RepID=UPI001F567E98|nr:hypothetical protein [Aestuariivivens sediminis]